MWEVQTKWKNENKYRIGVSFPKLQSRLISLVFTVVSFEEFWAWWVSFADLVLGMIQLYWTWYYITTISLTFYVQSVPIYSLIVSLCFFFPWTFFQTQNLNDFCITFFVYAKQIKTKQCEQIIIKIGWFWRRNS